MLRLLRLLLFFYIYIKSHIFVEEKKKFLKFIHVHNIETLAFSLS